MENSTFIYAQKAPNLKSKFTQMIWKNMGANKNGWKEITKEQFEAEGPAPAPKGGKTQTPEDVQKEAKYKEVYGQAKGLETDGEFEKAIKKFEEALAIKPNNKGLKTKINKLKQTIIDLAKAEEIEKGNVPPPAAPAKTAKGTAPAPPAPKGDEAYNELIKVANEALAAEDKESALETFKEAQKLKPTPEIAKQIQDLSVATDDMMG